jgi:uncharacterized glyoxalase superfamily protein PhnB
MNTLSVYLCVADGRRAVRWYTEAFDARRRGEPYIMPDGRLGHAELEIGDSVLMLADEWPELDLLSPTTRGGPSMSVYLEAADADATVERAVGLGARLAGAVTDEPHGRQGTVIDPFGHRWMIVSPLTASADGSGGSG